MIKREKEKIAGVFMILLAVFGIPWLFGWSWRYPGAVVLLILAGVGVGLLTGDDDYLNS